MLGAIIGDIVGSRWEFNPTNDYDFELFSDKNSYTDATICTIAVADALLHDSDDYGKYIHKWCRKYPHPMGGYGGRFDMWVKSDNPQPYGSYGNGSDMRCSPIGWWFEQPGELAEHAKKSAEMSDAILGALDYKPEEIAQIKFFIEHHDDFINFKREDEEWNRKNRFLRGINPQNVARKIQETKEDISIYGGYNPNKKDYQLLLRLCKADANAQSRIVREYGKVTDSRANKISRLSQVEDLVPQAYDLSLEMTAESIKKAGTITPQLEKAIGDKIDDKVQGTMHLFGNGRKKIVVDDDIKQYEQELREVYIHDGGPTGPAVRAKIEELFKRGMTEEQNARLSKVLGLEFNNKLIGGIDEIHKGGKLTKLFDVKKVLMERNHDAEKLLQQYEDRLKRQGIEQDK